MYKESYPLQQNPVYLSEFNNLSDTRPIVDGNGEEIIVIAFRAEKDGVVVTKRGANSIENVVTKHEIIHMLNDKILCTGTTLFASEIVIIESITVKEYEKLYGKNKTTRSEVKQESDVLKDSLCGDTVYFVDGSKGVIIDAVGGDYPLKIECHYGIWYSDRDGRIKSYAPYYILVYPYPVKVVPIQFNYHVASSLSGAQSISNNRFKTLLDFLNHMDKTQDDFEWVELVKSSEREV